jgi:hypothetical protein
MLDHLIIDASRQPAVFRCTRCGACQPVKFPMAINRLAELERQFRREHPARGPCQQPPEAA